MFLPCEPHMVGVDEGRSLIIFVIFICDVHGGFIWQFNPPNYVFNPPFHEQT